MPISLKYGLNRVADARIQKRNLIKYAILNKTLAKNIFNIQYNFNIVNIILVGNIAQEAKAVSIIRESPGQVELFFHF